MELSEFLESKQKKDEAVISEELDVQKAVVESLAADKAEQDEEINKLQRENKSLQAEISNLRNRIEEMKVSLEKVGDRLAKNEESTETSKVSLLDRNAEIDDRFLGETRDHVLEVIKQARDEAEKTGHIRKAQVLESVLMENEPVGTLQKKRLELKKLFEQNGNIITGAVIEELSKLGISHKNGESYLLPSEIIDRTY